jgi:preprotein translocase subunit SecF
MFKIIQNRKWWFMLSGIVVLSMLASLAIWGLKPAIDFTGGSLMEIQFTSTEINNEAINKVIVENAIDENPVIQTIGENRYFVRLQEIDEVQHELLTNKLTELDAGAEELRFEFIGPVIGQELKEKAIYAILAVILAIILYVAWAFRKVSYQVSSWKYGIIAVIALIHDIAIVVGIFAILGNFMNVEIGLPFVAALLTILGYSVNDTIVVFDRVRENLHKKGEHKNFEETVNISVNESLSRSFNTSITTLIVLGTIFLFGGMSIHYFILALIIGMIAGTYSSIFLAASLLVEFNKYGKKAKK